MVSLNPFSKLTIGFHLNVFDTFVMSARIVLTSAYLGECLRYMRDHPGTTGLTKWECRTALTGGAAKGGG
jgi:hypothetical protein